MLFPVVVDGVVKLGILPIEEYTKLYGKKTQRTGELPNQESLPPDPDVREVLARLPDERPGPDKL